MGGGAILNAAVTEVKKIFTLNSQQASQVGLIPDTLACIYGRLTQRSVIQAAENAIEWHLGNLKRFAFVHVPGEGLAKAGKVDRGIQPERQKLTPEVPLVGPASYQGARAAEQALVDLYSSDFVGSHEIRKFNVLKGDGDADGNQAYLTAYFNGIGVPCFDPASLTASAQSQPQPFKLLYDVNANARLSLSEWRALRDLLSSPDLDLSSDLPEGHSFFVPPFASSTPQSSSPSLSILQLSRDRDGVWSDGAILALSLRTFSNSIIVEYVRRDEVWEAAGKIALAKWQKHRKEGLERIERKRKTRREAESNPTSIDGRLLSSASYVPTLEDAKMQWLSQRLKPATSEYHDIDDSFVRGFRSFLFPLIRQSCVIGVPSSPTDLAREVRLEGGESSLKSGVYVYKNEVAAGVRRRAIEQIYIHLRTSQSSLPISPTEEDLDSPAVVMEALHYLEAIPREGFRRTRIPRSNQAPSSRETRQTATGPSTSTAHSVPIPNFTPSSANDSSNCSTGSSSPSSLSPLSTGLLGAVIKPPLQGHLWSEQDHAREGTGEYCLQLLNKVDKPVNDDLQVFEVTGQIRRDGEEEFYDGDEDDEINGDEGEAGDEDEEDEDYEPYRPDPKYRRAYLARLRQERITQLEPLIRQKLPQLAIDREQLSTLPGDTLREGLEFLRDEEAENGFKLIQGQYFLLYSSYLTITTSAQSPQKMQEGTRKLLSLLDVGILSPLLEWVDEYMDYGAMESPAVHMESILPLLFLHRILDDVNKGHVLQFIYLTSLPDTKWTSTTPPSLTYIKAALSDDPPADSPIRCSDYTAFRYALRALRKIAVVFDLAPPESLKTLEPDRLNPPQLTKSQLQDCLGSFFARTSEKRHLVSLTQLRDAIKKGGGPHMYGTDLGTLGKGIAMSVAQHPLQYQLIRHCWKWMEDLVVATVGEDEFEEIGWREIDWEGSDSKGYIVSK